MESIKVLVRVRPLHTQTLSGEPYSATAKSAINVSPDCKSISLNAHRQLTCQYNHVFRPNALQSEVYEHVKCAIQSILQGYNATILAYGQTGSGKSHTMFGKDGGIRSNPGVVPRCIKDIFRGLSGGKSKASMVEPKGRVYVSFLQVYNEQVYDMFDASMKSLAVHERNGDVVINQLSEYEVHNVDQALALVDLGLKNRSIRETGMNHASSRSHSILQVKVEQIGIVGADRKNKSISSKLNLVDLAGSERWAVGGIGMGDEQISELTNINSSLHTLGRCIAALATKSRERRKSLKSPSKHVHVPYRDSKLTTILSDSLSGNSKTCLVATINPLVSCADDSIGTLRFADRAHQVMTHAQLNEKDISAIDPQVQRLQDEVTRLKQILKDHGISVDPPQDSNLTPLPHLNMDHSQNHFIDNSSDEAFYSKSSQLYDYSVEEEFFDATEVSVNGSESPRGSNRNFESSDPFLPNRYTPKEPALEKVDNPDTSNKVKHPANQSALQNIPYKRLMTILNSILVLVDSFTATIASSTSNLEDRKIAEISKKLRLGLNSSTIDTRGLKLDETRNDKISRQSKLHVPSLPQVQQSRKATQEDRSTTKPRLSALLQMRKELKYIPPSTMATDEISLKEELAKSRKKVEEKQQLREWLLEREQQAENPIAAYLTNAA